MESAASIIASFAKLPYQDGGTYMIHYPRKVRVPRKEKKKLKSSGWWGSSTPMQRVLTFGKFR